MTAHDNQSPAQPVHQNPDVDAETVARNKEFGKKLVFLIVAMFGVAAASIPIYRIVCLAVDPGGSAWQNGETDIYENVSVDESRTIKVRFSAEVNRQLPWAFEAPDQQIELHPGEKKLVRFKAKNLDSAHPITGQAVYDINPPMAGQHFKKIECFCFTEQTLQPGEEVEMPLYLWFDPEISDDIKEITVAYTFFNADTSRTRQAQQRSSLDR